MRHDAHAGCPAAETLVAFAEGKLKRHEQPAVLAHINGCIRCMTAIEALNEDVFTEEEKPEPRSALRVWLVAAAVVAALLAIPAVRILTSGPSVSRLVALAPRTERSVEPRLTGGFAWAAYAGPARATRPVKDAQRMKFEGAAGELVERADRGGDTSAQHAAGVAMVLVDEPVDAIARLESAAAKSNDAKVWSDLAAARYTAASRLARASLYPLALAAADSALRIDPNLSEALFNRALILERLGLTDEAKRAWQRYLEVDPSSPWAAEARTRMNELPAATRSSQFDRARPLLERAAENGDADTVRRYVAEHRDRARAFAEAEYLGRWAEALLRGDAREAERWLSIARQIASALVEVNGESLPRDAVGAIDRASADERRAIADAHVAYRSARIAYSRDQRDVAESGLLRAAAAFEAVGDPMSLQARYYAASARLARSDVAGALADLERARAVADRHPSYVSHGAHVRWELGRALIDGYDYDAGVKALAESAAMFRRAGERASEAFTETMLAQAFSALGRDDAAWLARSRAFTALSAEGATEYLARSVAAAMQDELGANRRDAALALSAVEASIARSGERPVLAVDALVSRALLASMSGDAATAMQAARQANELATNVADPALRARWVSHASIAMGAALAETAPRNAIETLGRAIDFYATHDLPSALPDPLLLRARARMRLGDVASAMGDLERGMQLVETHRPATPGAAPRTVLDAEHALFTDAIRIRVDRGETAAAFALAERLRGTTTTLAQLQQTLAGSGTAVLEIVPLPEETIAFAIAARDVAVARHRPHDADLLAESGTTAAAALYDDLIRPFEAVLGGARELVIVGDPAMPYAALYDRESRRHLVERFAVSTAASAGSLQREIARDGAPVVVAISLPSGGVEAAGLPETDREVRGVAALYPHATTIFAAEATFAKLTSASADAGIVHIAGHTERQPGGGEQALLFADAPVSWKTIVASPARRGVVVLAACETFRRPHSAATRALSLAEAFSHAGAADVVGTLAPIGDRAARLLFEALHRQLAAGVRPAEALRNVQRDAIAIEKSSGERGAWRAVALLTRRVAAPQA